MLRTTGTCAGATSRLTLLSSNSCQALLMALRSSAMSECVCVRIARLASMSADFCRPCKVSMVKSSEDATSVLRTIYSTDADLDKAVTSDAAVGVVAEALLGKPCWACGSLSGLFGVARIGSRSVCFRTGCCCSTAECEHADFKWSSSHCIECVSVSVSSSVWTTSCRKSTLPDHHLWNRTCSFVSCHQVLASNNT